jgi:hypothetical protein
MALTKRDLVQIAALVKDAVAIATSVTPAGAIARTGYAVAKRTPQGEAFINELTSRGYDALQVAIAIQQEFASERPMDNLLTELGGGTPSLSDFKIRPLGVPLPKLAKRKPNKFSKAVKVGMKTVKDSTSYGGKGVINNAKKAFTTVVKTASKINKGAKVAKKGLIRKIGLAVKKVLK